MPDIAQTNPWLMTRSVPGPGDLRENLGKLVEQMMCSLSQLVNTLTTYGGGILTTDNHSLVIRRPGLLQKCYVILIELNLGPMSQLASDYDVYNHEEGITKNLQARNVQI